ncbi:hypothetical protein BQ8794_50169 [Mesorhizobium prunaredense]|uniref:Uncharacterized protein n=1 Tax=Mesorhizobium prunaredense TaxID=1631249 RepID=A0A1R3VI29_9HYPH|nr:hypothetical protein BQ8794_50169 [Mesorhizobium prunaredense]
MRDLFQLFRRVGVIASADVKTKLYPILRKNGRNTNGLGCTADITARANDPDHNQSQNFACHPRGAR